MESILYKTMGPADAQSKHSLAAFKDSEVTLNSVQDLENCYFQNSCVNSVNHTFGKWRR